jgi:hypothetical protein
VARSAVDYVKKFTQQQGEYQLHVVIRRTEPERHIKPEPGIKTESVPCRTPPLSAISPFKSPESFMKRVQEDVDEYTLAATELAGPASQATPAGSEAARTSEAAATSEAASSRRPKNRSKRAASTALPRRTRQRGDILSTE